MENLIETRDVTKYFTKKKGIIRRKTSITMALDKVNIDIKENEILGLIGESGSGKTTLGLTLLKLLDPNSGQIIFRNQDITRYTRRELLKFREKTQMIFQDPFGSFNPNTIIYNSLVTPIKVFHKEYSQKDILNKALEVVEMVGLRPAEQFLSKFPNQLSGGQLQRLGIARAVINNPDFIVADEPVSMLDVSLRADILNIFIDLKKRMGKSMLFISHDIAVTQYVSDRIAVIHLGQIVEIAPSNKIVDNPLHPYTKLLIQSVPTIDLKKKWIEEEKEIQVREYNNEGKVECSFVEKCPFAMDICRKLRPRLKEVEKDHFVACFIYDK